MQVDAFTVVYHKFDSLVSDSQNCLSFLDKLDKYFSSHHISAPLLCSTAGKRSEGNLIQDGRSDGAASSQQPVPRLPEPAGHPQRQGFLTEKVRNHIHTTFYKKSESQAFYMSLLRVT